MIKQLSAHLAASLYNHASRPKYSLAVYDYGFQLLLSSGITIISIFILGFVLRSSIMTIVYLLSTCSLRPFCGGYHAPSYGKCYVSSLLLFLLTLGTGHVLQVISFHRYAEFFMLLCSYVIIWKHAPIIHPHHPLSEPLQKKARRTARFIAAIQIILWVFLSLFSSFSTILSASITAVAVLMMIPILRKGDFFDAGID